MSYRNEVCSKHAGAVSQYRVSMGQGGRNLVGYWAIISHREGMNTLLGRGDTEAAAWEVAAAVDRSAGLLATIDR